MDKEEVRVWSHSRLWLFENCPEAFKVKYIDKKFPDLPKSVEAYLGSIVHESLEWLYEKVKRGGMVDLDDLIKFYAEKWGANFADDIRMNNGKDEHFYFNKGIKFLIGYYQNNKPFKDNTIEIEKRILFPLDENEKHFVQGFVDRIVFNEELEEYEVHDYKTNEFMKSQDQVDVDRQLAFYHLGLQKLFGEQIRVKLLWHFLAHNRTIESRRTQDQLERLKRDTLELVKRIESNSEWKACGKKWCDWCDYKKKNGLDNW